MTERFEQREVTIDPEQAYEYLVLLRGEPGNVGGKRREFTPDEIARADQLIDQISASTSGISPISLRRMMFDSPIGTHIPGREDVKFGWFDFSLIAVNWVKPKKRQVDPFDGYRTIMKDRYLVGQTEVDFLRAGRVEISKRHRIAPQHTH